MGKSRYIMLVDDDQDDQDLFSEALQIVGGDVKLHLAENGIEALAHLERSIPPAPDFIFLDLNMPKLNGIEFLTAVRQNEKLNNVPVVIYSTSNALEHRAQTSALGAAHYMVKQNSFRQLCTELGQLLITA